MRIRGRINDFLVRQTLQTKGSNIRNHTN